MPNVLVVQSHRRPLPAAWLEPCLDSVRDWAGGAGFDYHYEDDRLLARLEPDLRERCREQPVVACDLARLALIDEALADYETVVWLDADTLVLQPERLRWPDAAYALGREVWIAPQGRQLKAWVKVHNAFLMFRRDNPLLAFYRHAAESIVRRHAPGPMVPQLVGPKLLSSLHNLLQCPLAEAAGVLSPAVIHELLAGGGPALWLFRARSPTPPACVNLCASSVTRGEVTAEDMQQLIEAAAALPARLAGA